MAVTTDFTEIIDTVTGQGLEEIYALYQAVQGRSSFGSFDILPALGSEDGFIIRTIGGGLEDVLIASPKAQDHFISLLKKHSCGEDDMEGWYYYHLAMSKED